MSRKRINFTDLPEECFDEGPFDHVDSQIAEITEKIKHIDVSQFKDCTKFDQIIINLQEEISSLSWYVDYHDKLKNLEKMLDEKENDMNDFYIRETIEDQIDFFKRSSCCFFESSKEQYKYYRKIFANNYFFTNLDGEHDDYFIDKKHELDDNNKTYFDFIDGNDIPEFKEYLSYVMEQDTFTPLRKFLFDLYNLPHAHWFVYYDRSGFSHHGGYASKRKLCSEIILNTIRDKNNSNEISFEYDIISSPKKSYCLKINYNDAVVRYCAFENL